MNITSLSALTLLGTLIFAQAQDATPAVRTVAPTPATEVTGYEVPGRTEPIESATIFTRATGIIKERNFEIGDVVKQGDILATINAPEIDRAVESAKANVEQARARATNALNLFHRSSRLLKSDVVSTEESEQRQSTAIETAAGVRVAEADLSRLEEQQRFSTVQAPFDGVISARNRDRGDLVRGDASTTDGWIYRLNRLNTLRFVVNATPDLALRLAPDRKAIVKFSEFPGQEFPAKVAHSSRLFESATGTMRVELLIENPDLALPAGLTGTAQFTLPPMAGTYLVPTNTLTLKEGKNMIATVTDGKVHFLEVLPGRNLGRNVEVVSSKITPDTTVILNPNAMLREGDAVSPAPLTAAK